MDTARARQVAERLGLQLLQRDSAWVLKTRNPDPQLRFMDADVLSGTFDEIEAALKKQMGWDCPKCGNHSSVISCERAEAWSNEINSRPPVLRAWDRWKYRPKRR